MTTSIGAVCWMTTSRTGELPSVLTSRLAQPLARLTAANIAAP
jgi:hypothetical protein